MKFTPTDSESKIEAPFFGDNLRAADGWAGHNCGKTVSALKSELSASLGRLDAAVTGFQRGLFTDESTGLKREGMIIFYSVPTESGELWPGKLSIAALPVNRKTCVNEASYKVKIDRSLRMALSMAITALKGAWNMRVLSPGYSPLVPWMIADNDGNTFSDRYRIELEGSSIPKLPAKTPTHNDIIVDFEEIDD